MVHPSFFAPPAPPSRPRIVLATDIEPLNRNSPGYQKAYNKSRTIATLGQRRPHDRRDINPVDKDHY